MYQHMDYSLLSFQQVSGPGSGAFTLRTTPFPASVNPPISPTDRLSAQDGANKTRIHFDTVTAQIDSRIFGQHLSYVGSYEHQFLDNLNVGAGSAQGDLGNVLPGVELYGHTRTGDVVTTQEVRLASEPAPDRFFDYTVGAFYQWQNPMGHVDQPGPLLPGAFGPPPGINLSLFNPAYMIPIAIDIPSTFQETSLFGSVTFHLGPNTELSGGIRRIWSVVNNHTTISTETGQAAVPAALFGGNCAATRHLPCAPACLRRTRRV
jgi:iron complex outermembrane receptor protein